MFGASLLLILSPLFGTVISSSICDSVTPPSFVTRNATTTTSSAPSLQLLVPAAAYSASGITTTSDSLFLRGTTSPGAQAVILDNGKQLAELTAACNGTFGVSIPLTMGINHITISSSLNGHTTTQTITYVRTAVLPHSSSKLWWWLVSLIVVIGLITWWFITARIKRRLTQGETPNELG